ncbi:hypothetical protein BDZ94DRAFT_1307104 [Collybia nuda]|uniref:F-box domain-containing protein n=1 Tax=Collybia nuda TaxID=64659 RepID=A0A9P6CM25_9AGAR|nr:hypothetical protein BDZ94DRAFT_1307104 [Collybia nuda]
MVNKILLQTRTGTKHVDFKLPQLNKISEQPPEIITQIFKSASGDTVILPQRLLDCPWILGHVCSHWRKILWASPSVWSNITIERRYLKKYSYQISRSPASPGSAIRESLSYIISRTTSPLSLTIKDGNADDRFPIILAYAGRFRCLSFDYISPEALALLLNLHPNTFTLLEKFSATTFTRNNTLIPNASPLETAPRLRSVNWCIMNIGYISQCLLLPLEKMTEIRVQRMLVPLTIVRKILLSSPKLVHCTFSISADVILSSHHEVLPDLQTLHLETPQTIEWSEFLKSFTIPALEDFSILSPCLPLYPVNSLLERSNCHLKSLSLVLLDHHVESTDPNGVESLISQLTMSIVTLNLSWITSGLIFWKIQHKLVPKIERIRLNVDENGLEAFINLANSYTDETAAYKWSLKKVEMCCWVEVGTIERCTRWAKSYNRFEGLEIAIFDAETGIDMMDLPYMDHSDGTKPNDGDRDDGSSR